MFIFGFIWLLLLLVGFVSFWYIGQFGSVSIEAILFHMAMPLKGAPNDIYDGLWAPIYLSFMFWFIIVYLAKKYKILKKYFWIAGATLFLIDMVYVNENFKVFDFIKNQYESSNFIEEHYVYPEMASLQFPKNKKNIIIIQVESLESSYQDINNGGLFPLNYIPELTNIAKNNISFSASSKLEGAAVLPESGWTIAGIVSETAGIPLKLFSHTFVDDVYDGTEIDNSLGQYRFFLPGVVSLGDILEQKGYSNYFVLGRHAEFAGKKDYFEQHGHYQIIDQSVIEKQINKTNVVDADVFEFLKLKWPEIIKNTPVHLFIQTADTHYGTKQEFSEASKYVSDFVEWLQRQGNDNLIVIIGDHCNMNHASFMGIEQDDFRYNGNIKRRVFNAFINSSLKPKNMKDRHFATLDFFPTILSAAGVRISGDRLGLGTDLFSDRPTLLEEYGYNLVFQEIKKKSNFYNRKLLYK